MTTRAAAVAGMFYPAAAVELRAEIAEFAKSEPETARAVVAPHAGYQYSGETANLAISSLPRGTRRAIIIGPTHNVPFDGISVGLYDGYETPLGVCAVDGDACEGLLATCPQAAFRQEVHEPEHAIEVELPLLQVHCPDAAIVPIVAGRLGPDDCRAVAGAILPWLRQPDTVLIISTDFTHYGARFGFAPFSASSAPRALKEMDLTSVDHLLAMDAAAFRKWKEQTGTTICGWLPLVIMLHLLNDLGEDLEGRLLRYCNSGEISGSWSNAVGYAGLVFAAGSAAREPDAADQESLLRFARAVIAARLTGDEPPPEPSGLSAACQELRGGFVSLHCNGALRGCIGTIEAVTPTVETVRKNALAAAFRDPRFPPLRPEELVDIEIEISLLSEPRRISRADGFRVGEHGIILQVANRRSVFLPQVATEQGWDRVETLRHLAKKAGVGVDAWRRPDAELSVFTATVFAE